ncbi:NAD(P)H-binding protein [Burkholderia multivorans]|uniref:NAD(P)H-binding protein n=1 Tax=Burkholderia multivorans TaxID=87883 RepID=UPI001C23D283|nr:NAD(P)H-binding protein [Burkholderia multivorans]MBU9610635.1 NAD(P)H-binding protein [Burkholderia multivorans]
MYAITGATGHLGRKVIASLKGRIPASSVVAVARSAARATDLGVAVREADYADIAALEIAFAGIEKLLLISSSSLDARQAEHANVIAAAKKARVQHIVYTSLLHAQRWTVDFKDDHLQTEKWIVESGLNYTMLRNGWYWENNTMRLPAAVHFGSLIGSAGDARISWASRQDFADAAVAVLTGAGHDGKTYELAGDTAYTFEELAAEAERQSGRSVVYKKFPEADFAAALEKVGLPKPMALMVAEIEARGVSTGVLEDDSGVLSKLIGRPTTTIKQAVSEALQS